MAVQINFDATGCIGEVDGIEARAANNFVVAAASYEHVIAGVARQSAVTRAAVDDIIAFAA